MYQIRNFWFDNGANEILKVASIIPTLASSTIKIIEVVNLNNEISEISRNWKNHAFTTSIKSTLASIKSIAIIETMQNINHYFNIWKKQFIVLAVANLKIMKKLVFFVQLIF